MQTFITIAQIIISIALAVAILLQQRSAGGVGLLGGSSGGGYYRKRGFEKILFTSTVILSALFLISAFLNLVI